MISALSKLSNRQPIQQLAFHKQQCEINGVSFECHESYYEGELLNGVDLKVKAVRGLANRQATYDYLQDSQQLVFAASAHLMVYNTHRRNYHQLFSLQGEVQLLRTHLEKMNSHEYILWVEGSSSPLQATSNNQPSTQIHRNKTHSRMVKRTGSFNHRQMAVSSTNRTSKPLLKSIFSLFPEGPTAQDANFLQSISKAHDDNGYNLLRVYNYTKKQFIFQGGIQLRAGQALKEVFLFMNHYKILGYITEDYEKDVRYIYYKNLDSKTKANNDPFGIAQPSFLSITTTKNVERVIFNNELNHFLFVHKNTLNAICIGEDTPDAEHQLFKQFLSLSQGKGRFESGKAVHLQVKECAAFQQELLSITLNEQYVAVLTSNKIHFHSAFDPSTLIFTYTLQSRPFQPLNIEFNKTAFLLTYRNSATIFSYTVKGKVLKLVGQSALGVNHCKQILRIYTNNISTEIFCVVRFFELQSRDRLPNDLPTASLANQLLQGLVQYVAKPVSIDIIASFLVAAGTAEAVPLGLSRRKFRRLHSCPWLSGYVVQTEQAVQLGQWRQNFESKKCIAMHPSGLFFVVCLKEAFKIYLITQEGFVNSYRGDSLKDILACAISAEGNHLAISSTSAIHIYDFYSCQRLRTLNLPFGHWIQYLEYSGHTLVCHLRNKKVYLYDSLKDYRQSFAFNPKIFINDSNAHEQDMAVTTLLALTVSEIVTHITFSPFYYCPILNFFIYSYQSTVYFFNCTTNSIHFSLDLQPLSSIYYCANLTTLFLGTVSGQIICFSWPNKPMSLSAQQRKFKLHTGRILDIRVTSDLRQLVTIGEDETLSVCSLAAVRSLKRYEGLQLIQHLSGNIRICYDFLARRGVCLYTHSKMGEKNNIIKDHEDQVLNANFILPQERQKQKEQMFANVKFNMKDIAQGNQHQYDSIIRSTNEARDMVNKIRYQFSQFTRKKEREKEDIRQNMFNQYIKHYESSEKALKQQQKLTIALANQLETIKSQLAKELKEAQEQSRKKYEQLEEEHRIQVQTMKQDEPLELKQIDAEKQAFLGANISALDEIVTELNNSNGVLACRNNNLEKQIADLRRKMEQQGYLLYRLEGNTNKLKEQQTKYEKLKAQNKRQVQRQDKINLAQIQKRYVKQTQILIERDKQINVQLVNHQKEKNILIHLEKCLQGVEGSIQTLVSNILQEKKQRKEEVARIQAAKLQLASINADMIAAKKDKISSRNQLNNYLCKLEAIVQEIVNSRNKQHILQILKERDLINEEPAQTGKDPQEKELLSKILNEKVHATRTGGSKQTLLRTSRPNASYRMLKTQANQTYRRSNSGKKDFLAVTCRQAIEKRSKEVYMKLDAEQKQYERIKTEQLVFENTRKKFNLENQDLIQNYNSLAMENHKFVIALKKQQSMSRIPVRRQRTQKDQGSPTPFQLYLQNKANAHSQRAFVPLGSYEGRK